MVILVLFLLVILLAAAAFSVDVAYMQLARTQLRSATDAAARAGAEAVVRDGGEELAREMIKKVAARNLVAGEPLIVEDDDIVFGNTSPNEDGIWKFYPEAEPYNSVRLTGARTASSASGGVSLFFGSLLGTSFFEPTILTTAAKSAPPERDFCIVADRSHSMAFDLSGRDWSYPPGRNGQCFPPHPTLSRWAALVEAVKGFCTVLKDTEDEERVGLVSYAGSGRYCGER